jgi:uncharacterized protein
MNAPVFTKLGQLASAPRYRGFYAPAFEIRIEGVGLPRDILRDVTGVTYTDSLTEIDRFDVTVSNWDDDQRKYRFYGSETADDTANPEASTHPYTIFEPSKRRVELKLGYVDALVPMMKGRFVTVEPTFPAAGRPSITASALNELHRLRRKQHSGSWPNKKLAEIALDIHGKFDRGERRIGVDVRPADGWSTRQQPIEHVMQWNQHDIDFLLNLARQQGEEIELRPDIGPNGQPRRNPDGSIREYLWIGPSSASDAPVNLSLAWGATLIDFKPSMTVANQIKAVTVRYWDRRTQRAREVQVEYNNARLRRQNPDLQRVIERIEPRESVVVDRPVATEGEARSIAMAIMKDRNASLIKATGTTVGMPQLRSGTKVEITGLGARFGGQYLVTKTTHTIGESGYTTKFECRREHFAEGRR